jgi:transcriptional regulator with XRE-family HTH domain
MTFGQKLRELREAKGLSREALAQASGVPFGTIHGYEISRRAPALAATIKLAKALGVDCTAFADCDDIDGSKPAKKPTAKKRKK